MAGKAVDERERQFGQHAHIEVNHLQLLVAISSAGKAHQPEPRIVDDKLRLGAPSGQSLAYQVRHAGNEKIGCNDDRTASPGRGNFIGQRIQPLYSSRNQYQLVAMSPEDGASARPIPSRLLL